MNVLTILAVAFTTFMFLDKLGWIVSEYERDTVAICTVVSFCAGEILDAIRGDTK